MPRTSLCAACHAAGREGCPNCGAKAIRADVDIFAPYDFPAPPAGALNRHAIFSENRLYRYRLDRVIADRDAGRVEMAHGDKILVVCGLNPSVANETDNDPTITREIDFARRWGCHRLVKVNAYAWVSTDPKAMFAQKKKNAWDIVGPDNDVFIVEAVQECIAHDGIFLVAWGANIEPFRQQRLAEIIGDHAQCLKVNKDGTPGHPLYVRADTPPQRWSCP